ncbi:alpha/beta hydrolase [Nonlabens sp.]|uniref:alpha/beta fold hydrolase n=1 Tax=Nonlabens sp. TaxID=1888209 RepID=UPI0032657774
MKSTFISSNKEGLIVLLHGSSSSSKVFKNLQLTNSVLAPTLSGHEINENTDDNDDFSFKFYKRELIKLINSYSKPVFLIGNSIGGHLAIEISNDIKNLKGLMIFGTPPVKKPVNFEEAFLPVAALQTFLTEHPTQEEIEEAASITVYDDKYSAMVAADFNNSNPKVRVTTVEDITNGNWLDQYKIFTELKCPKFIVSGVQDPSVNPSYLKEVVEQSKGDAQLITIENCGHYPTLEKPEEMSEIINQIAADIFKPLK